MRCDRLTNKETEVLEALLTFPDLTRKETAKALRIAPKTMDIHIHHLLKKTGYRTVQGLLVELLKHLMYLECA